MYVDVDEELDELDEDDDEPEDAVELSEVPVIPTESERLLNHCLEGLPKIVPLHALVVVLVELLTVQ